MADNRDLPAVAGKVATDERTIAAETVHVQRIIPIGSTGFDDDLDTSVTTTVESVAARETRREITFYCPLTNTQDIQIGATNPPVGSVPPGGTLTLPVTTQIFYKATSGTQTLYWWEVWD